MASFLTLAEFKARTVMPPEDVDSVEARYAGFVAERLKIESAWIRARLIKRYEVESFGSPVPDVVAGWLTDIVTPQVYRRRGWNPSSEQDAQIDAEAARARAEVLEAAGSAEGMFELPLRQDVEGTEAVSKAGPLSYSEQDPYTWTDKQAEAVRSSS